jgi:hypothetical protein
MATKIILLFLLIITTVNFCKAQSAFTDTMSSGNHRKSVFVEGGGNGLGVSINYDIRLKPDRNDGFGIRAGAGIIGTHITLPLGINYIVGRRRSGFESGIGITPVYNFNTGEYARHSSFFNNSKTFTALGLLTAGYRLQSLNGFMFRANISAMNYRNMSAMDYRKRFLFWQVGLSIGLNF